MTGLQAQQEAWVVDFFGLGIENEMNPVPADISSGYTSNLRGKPSGWPNVAPWGWEGLLPILPLLERLCQALEQSYPSGRCILQLYNVRVGSRGQEFTFSLTHCLELGSFFFWALGKPVIHMSNFLTLPPSENHRDSQGLPLRKTLLVCPIGWQVV